MADWLGTYAKRIKVTASNTNVDSDLTHFPLLLTLGTSVGTGSTDVSCVFDELTSDANRTKIAVTKTDGETELYVEIEKWDDANEKAVLWVSKSDWVLDTDADTELYLYYDSAHAANTDRVGDTNSVVSESVWNSNFKLIQHFNQSPDGTTGEIIDSTSNDNDGTSQGSMTSGDLIDGKIGKALDFEGTDDYILVPTDNSLNFAGSSFTLESWVWVSDQTDTLGLFFKVMGSDLRYTILYYNDSRGFLVQYLEGSGRGYIQTYDVGGTITEDAWHHIVGVYSSADSAVYLYIDGSLIGSDASWTIYSTTISATDLNVGKTSTNVWKGRLDETRISSTNRSTAWIKASYYSGDDALVSWGSEEDIPSGTNMQINIGDSWKVVDKLQINIGDVWKTVTKVQQNIGDVWKSVF